MSNFIFFKQICVLKIYFISSLRKTQILQFHFLKLKIDLMIQNHFRQKSYRGILPSTDMVSINRGIFRITFVNGEKETPKAQEIAAKAKTYKTVQIWSL